MKFHVNAMGKALSCSAVKGRCPFGGSEDHYSSAQDAREAYENHMQQEFTKALKGFTKASKLESLRYEVNHPDALNQEETIQECIRNKRPMTQFERAQHSIYVEEIIKELEDSGNTTENTHATSTSRGLVFNADRVLAHNEIIEEIIKDSKTVPSEGKALFAGGLGGAGKSTVLEKYSNVDKSKYVTLNPDDIKEIMAAKGLIPKVEGLTPMEASPLVHEEASHITSVLLEKLRHRKKNIIFDITMASQKSVQNRINLISESGYSEVKAVFVDITPDTSAERGDGRYVYGLNQYLQHGEGQGGRPLPKRLTLGQAPDNKKFNSKNAEVLIGLQNLGAFTSTPRVFNNNVSGREPQEISFKNFSKLD